ncbi:hypothetical protein ACFOG5_16945 [Pedobacter fastidiosus]|uniref:Uncharacterized protein n=1 Tax=Pedobacter fastidiosus TaxID=2765361 RepID=A0ABR7KSB0_9SPHI|nr:hypothetical protein [Pedobacter fastidiosus]MBC6110720.1 hypothetical protein [Pedobacter fastidiosus]
MKAFRILLAFFVAGATFYSLNAFAVKNGYRDRLDFKNRHYHEYDCNQEHYRSQGYSHHNRKVIDTSITPIDSITLNK